MCHIIFSFLYIFFAGFFVDLVVFFAGFFEASFPAFAFSKAENLPRKTNFRKLCEFARSAGGFAPYNPHQSAMIKRKDKN